MPHWWESGAGGRLSGKKQFLSQGTEAQILDKWVWCFRELRKCKTEPVVGMTLSAGKNAVWFLPRFCICVSWHKTASQLLLFLGETNKAQLCCPNRGQHVCPGQGWPESDQWPHPSHHFAFRGEGHRHFCKFLYCFCKFSPSKFNIKNKGLLTFPSSISWLIKKFWLELRSLLFSFHSTIYSYQSRCSLV